MSALISHEKLTVHISTMEEAHEVVEWFESFGCYRCGLQPNVYMRYPYFYAREDKLLAGSSMPPGGNRVMEYGEWKDLVDDDATTEVEDTALYAILGF